MLGEYNKPAALGGQLMISAKGRVVDFALVLILLSALVALACLVSMRPVWVGTDTYAYTRIFYAVNDAAAVRVDDFLFLWLAKGAQYIWGEPAAFFFILSFVGFVGLLVAGVIATPSVLESNLGLSGYLVLLSALMLFSPFFLNTQINIVRHGVAVPFVILAYFALHHRRVLLTLIFSILALGFHSAMLMHIALLPLVFLRIGRLYAIVFLLAGFYLVGLSSLLTTPVAMFFNFEETVGRLESLGQWSNYKSGVRHDFLLFSILVIASIRVGVKFKIFDAALEQMAVAALIPFLLFGYIAYSDRFLVALWALVPTVCAGFIWRVLKLRYGGELFIYWLLFIAGFVVFLKNIDFINWNKFV